MNATRADVAARAGVSPALVSYVLNGGPRPVSAAARDRILKAVEELQYRPNSVARSLRMQSTRTVGLIVPDNANPFFAELSRAIETELYRADHVLLLGNALGDPTRQAQYVRTFLDQQVDGLVIVPSAGVGDEWLAEIKTTHTPLVVMDRRLDRPTVSSVMINNQAGAQVAVEHLAHTHQRTRIGCLAGPETLPSAQQRYEGWRTAIERLGLDPDRLPVGRSDFSRVDARRTALDLLADPGLDALFVTSDEQALGVVRAAAELGRQVPHDLAVVTFDGISAGQFAIPTLSTMRQPMDLMARAVADLIINERDTTGHRLFDATLVPGESCGCLVPPRCEQVPDA